MENPQRNSYNSSQIIEINFTQEEFQPTQHVACEQNCPKSPNGYLPEKLEYSGPIPPPPYELQPDYLSPPEYAAQPEYTERPGNPTHPGEPEQPYEPIKYALWPDIKRNRPQSRALTAATLIFSSGGMSFAQSVGFLPVLNYTTQASYIHMEICWFVAVIIGAIISTIFIQKVSKRVFNLISANLVMFNGILFTAASSNVAAIAVARYCDGIAFGLTVVPVIVGGSELSVKRFRGVVLTVEQLGLANGITMNLIYRNFWLSKWEFNVNQMHGIIALLYGVLAFGLTFFLTLESPIFYLRRNNETEAINALRRLQRPQIVTGETYDLLYEHKLLLKEDNARGWASNFKGGILPIIKICIYRALVTMSFSLPLTWIFITASDISDTQWSVYTYSVMRALGVLLTLFTVDSSGRKLFSSCSIFVGGALLITVGAICLNIPNSNDAENYDAIVGLMLTYQVFSGIAAPASTSYLGEAFSVSVKPYFILVAIVFENVIQIIICCTFDKTTESMAGFGLALGILQVVFGIVFLFVMPETKKTTLREALAMFKKALHIVKIL